MRESNEAKVNRLIDKGKMKIVRTGTRSIIIATQAFSFFFFGVDFMPPLYQAVIREILSRKS